jgi:hypothetical protein
MHQDAETRREPPTPPSMPAVEIDEAIDAPTDVPVYAPPPQPPAQQPYYHYPGPVRRQPEPRRGGGIGCWIVGLLTMMLAGALVVAGLLLPPFNLAERLFQTPYVMLDAEANGTRSDDRRFVLSVSAEDPGQEFGVLLDTVALADFTAGSPASGQDWIAPARAAIPPYLALQSDLYAIETTGTSPAQTTLQVALPTGALRDVIDLYGWDATRGEWRFIPSQLNVEGRLTARVSDVPDVVALFQGTPLPPAVIVMVDAGQPVDEAIAGLATILAPSGMQPALPTTPSGTLIGNPALSGEGRLGGYLVMPVIRNYADPRATDPGTVADLINNRDLRDQHIDQLVQFTGAGRYDGIFIDYRDLPMENRAAFSAFISALADNLGALDLMLGVIVPAAENVSDTWETGAYDWRVIGQAADLVQVEMPIDPTAYTPGPDRLAEAIIRWGVGEVDRYKLVGALSARSLRQTVGRVTDFTPVGYDEALAAVGDVDLGVQTTGAESVLPGSEIVLSLDGFDALPGVDTSIQSPYIEYLADDGTITTRIWLTTGEALRFRMDRLAAFGLAGVSFEDLLRPGLADSVTGAILDFKTQTPSPTAQTQLALRWRIEGAGGVVTEFTTGLNEEPVITLTAPDGNYAVNVDVISGGSSSSRGGAAIALFAPTPTPTPRPTSTPRPTATVTPTLAPVVPTPAPQQAAPPAPSGGGAPALPPPGSIGALELGGHVTSASSARAVNAMRTAGMTWMKVQVRYRLGAGASPGEIQAAQAAGFRVLLGVVGDPGELAAAGGDYIRQYAQYVGELAALGADAIEVWNEPNLAREWPEGQISGANYVALLSQSYQAIKSRNPNTLVISAAPAPTGAEAAFPGRVVNDNNWLAQVVAANGLNYADCVGMHYNEGVVSATATSGDFRDNYYTRYLPTMLSTYASIVGGRPICITELGYLTPEGYPPLTEFFAWGQNTTVAQQAAWLAEAAAVSAQSGRVRMMIVWNIDFQNYGADPMAGFAIIRPDGSCPACSALAGAR